MDENLSTEENLETIVKADDDLQKTENGLIFNPYNPINKYITKNNLETILSKYGIYEKINNYELYKRAFIHKSYTKRPFLENQSLNITVMEKPFNCLPLNTKSNERLEFLGDGILECITKYYLYRRFPKADEGFMTEKKIALVKNENIGKLAYDMQLHNFYIISKHAEEKKTRTNLKKLGCLFESFLGAIFLDFNKNENEDNQTENIEFITGPGFQFAQIFVENVFETHIDWSKLLKTDDNYKNQLQVKIQKEFKITPDYLEIKHDLENGYEMGVFLCIGQNIWETNLDNALNFSEFKTFLNIQNYLENNEKVFILLGKGIHKIKKKAEQIACENFLTQNNC